MATFFRRMAIRYILLTLFFSAGALFVSYIFVFFSAFYALHVFDMKKVEQVWLL